MELTGQCLCGAVRYSFVGDPQLVFLCHCRDCQQSGGSLAHFGVWVPDMGFSVRGKLRPFTKVGESGREVTREFCPTCGSGICNRLEVAPGAVVIKGGTLHDPAAVPATFELFARSKSLTPTLGTILRSFEAGLTCSPDEVAWSGPACASGSTKSTSPTI